MRRYIWQLPGWPNQTADAKTLLALLDQARKKQYAFLGALSLTGTHERLLSMIDTLTATAIDTTRIEGETLNPASVRSSVARRLGVEVGGARQDDRTEGVVAMTLDAVRNYSRPLTADRLRGWHAGLFPTRIGERPQPWMGQYRSPDHDPMRVLSGAIGHERTHFEAPPASDVPTMMDDFLAWFHERRGNEHGLVHAAIAHLWFLTIHPFVDGNGRIARAIADMALAQDEDSGDRFYSLSTQIQQERSNYYDALERAQRGGLDVTEWVAWFVESLIHSIEKAQDVVTRARAATEFWSAHVAVAFNERQRRVLWRILGNFEGDLNLRKYMAISGAPRATAQRDLTDLVEAHVLSSVGQGKATRYLLTRPEKSISYSS